MNMLPPIDPTVLSGNPNFNALYSDLCNNKLNADGTSKLDAKAQRDHDALRQVWISLLIEEREFGADDCAGLIQSAERGCKKGPRRIWTPGSIISS